MNPRRIESIALGAIALFMLPVGLQAAVAPQSFFDDFPFGRGWIAAEGGVYDEHLVRDVGVLFLAMIIVTVWALWRPAVVRPIAVAWLFQGVLHFTYHVGHLDGYDGFDKFALLGSLIVVPVLAVIALLADKLSATPRPT